MTSRSPRLTAVYGALGLMLLALPASAQVGAKQEPTSRTPTAAPAGAYSFDAEHSSLIVRILHKRGLGFMVLRMAKSAGTLDWNPFRIEASKLDIIVDMHSIDTPVPGFAKELEGADFFDVDKYPEAHFVSTAIRRTGPDRGMITGDLTWLGHTNPVTIDAQLMGIAHEKGGTIIGLHGTAVVDRAKFGSTALGNGAAADNIDLVIDAEFDRGLNGQ